MTTRALFILVAIAIASFASVIAYVLTLGENSPFGIDPGALLNLSVGSIILLVIVVGFIFKRIYATWRSFKSRPIGRKLQRRILITFGLIAIIPTLLVAIFSTVFFNVGVRAWFSDRVATALNGSLIVAEAYLEEHGRNIRADAIAMKGDISNDLAIALSSPATFQTILNTQTRLRSLSEAIVVSRQRVIARSEFSLSLMFEQLPPAMFRRADNGDVVLLTDEQEKLQALIKIDELSGTYLLIGRLIDSDVIRHMQNTQGAVTEYAELRRDITGIQDKFTLFFIVVALLLLLIALWVGFVLALRIVNPIAALIDAAERVKAGDYTAQVPEGAPSDEIATLGRSFNRMTEQLQQQRGELIKANRRLNERRRMMEAVFSGVSVGVIALDEDLTITVHNHQATALLCADAQEDTSLIDTSLSDIFEEVLPLMQRAREHPSKQITEQINIKRTSRIILSVRITTEEYKGEIEGFIVTLDDVTPLVSAQRNAAWADVARRIAHEIKNPLTPIQLSTERLKSKFAPQISEDLESYQRYLSTIEKHVGDIGAMVEEFSSFARMPRPQLAQEDLKKVIRDAVFSEKTAHSDIEYRGVSDMSPMLAQLDKRQVGQIFLNLLKNAAESIEQRLENDPKSEKGRIQLHAIEGADSWVITIEDNGIGFPEDKLASLTEPYVTTRAKGTGLGLAIVKKHMEEHGGSLALAQRPVGGAKVTLAFPKQSDVKKSQ